MAWRDELRPVRDKIGHFQVVGSQAGNLRRRSDPGHRLQNRVRTWMQHRRGSGSGRGSKKAFAARLITAVDSSISARFGESLFLRPGRTLCPPASDRSFSDCPRTSHPPPRKQMMRGVGLGDNRTEERRDESHDFWKGWRLANKGVSSQKRRPLGILGGAARKRILKANRVGHQFRFLAARRSAGSQGRVLLRQNLPVCPKVPMSKKSFMRLLRSPNFTH